jgi:hypothetical protein
MEHLCGSIRLSRRSLGLLSGTALCALLAAGQPAYALVITPTFASNITSDPNAAAIEGVINSAISTYQADFTDPINVAITFQEGGGLGGSSTFFFNVSYATYHASLVADGTTANDTTALTRLAVDGSGANNPVTNNSTINVKSANLRAVGLTSPGVGPGTGNPDGTITLNTSLTFPGSPGTSSTYSLLVVTEHEIDEVLGLGSALPSIPFSDPFPEDLFRFDSTGIRSFTTSSAAQAFFSINGTTDLAQFHNVNDGADFGDWQSNPLPPGVSPKVQDAFASAFATPSLGVELTALDVIGYNFAAQVAVPEPGTLALLGSSLLGFAALRRRRQ